MSVYETNTDSMGQEEVAATTAIDVRNDTGQDGRNTSNVMELLNGYSSNSSTDLEACKGDTCTLKAQIKAQVEYYFSQQNLIKDNYMVSQMDSEGYIPISIIAQFRKVKKLTNDLEVIVSAITGSKVCQLNEDNTMLKSNCKLPARTTVVIRDAPEGTSDIDIWRMFEDTDFIILSVRCDMGHEWCVTMSTEEQAISALTHLSTKSLFGNAISTSLRSELMMPNTMIHPAYNSMAQPMMPPHYSGFQPYPSMAGGYPNPYYGPLPSWNAGVPPSFYPVSS